MIRRLRREDGFAVGTAMLVMAVMLAVGLALFAFVDAQSRQSTGERDREAAFSYAEALADMEGFVTSTDWPATAPGMPDCSYNGTTVTATGGTGGTAKCPSPAQLAATFGAADYSGPVTWTARVRDNGGTEQCSVITAQTCSYFYDDAALASQPPRDANGDGQVWIRAQAVFRGFRRTIVERVQLDRQAVTFPKAVVTADHMSLKESPHLKVVTNFSPINLRCAINSAGCLTIKQTKQIAPYKITFSYAQQTAIPPSSVDDLRKRAQAEGWYYATCPTNPPGSQVFVESGSCTGASMPTTSPSSRGTYIQVNGTLTISGKQPNSANASKGRKGNYWGLIYLANQSKLTGDVLIVKKGKRLISGVIAIDYGGGLQLGGSKDTVLQYDPFALDGLYLYQGSTVVRPSFRDVTTNTP